jgi:heat shock protein HtpX
MWATSKRIVLFLVTNILILITLSAIWSVASAYLGLDAGSYNYLLLFCVIFGFGGAFISLLMSKFMAKMFMKVKVIPENTSDMELRSLVSRVHSMARMAGIRKMPEVGIYESPELNAFATGPSKNNALVAVSTGLLKSMNAQQIDGVLGHEVSHIANGDMVTMTLIQGIINAMVMFAARVLAGIVESAINKNSERGSFWMRYMLIFAFEMLFSFLGMIVVTYFSRAREFRADAGGARLAGKSQMISALQALGRGTQVVGLEQNPAVASLKISGKSKKSWARYFMTHPPIEDRILALQRAQIS